MLNLMKRKLFGYRASNKSYIAKLKEMGAEIGEDVTIHYPFNTRIDLTSPWLLTIGSHVNITGPATILTHDYSWSVIKGKTGEILGCQRPVTIGSNVFIGWGATVLCGTTIEDNVIIGAHSVVSGHLIADSVYAGVPARRICSLEEYRAKRMAAQIPEAQEYVRCFRSRCDRDPRPDEISEYFTLFIDSDHLEQSHLAQLRLMGTYKQGMSIIESAERPFESYDAFLESC